MRRLLVTLVAACFPLPSARADDAEVKAVIDKAVKALGGEAVLARAGVFSVKVKFHHLDSRRNPREIVYVRTIQGAERMRMERFAQGQVPGRDDPESLLVWNGDRRWEKSTGQVKEEKLVDALGHARLLAAINLAPLRDGTFQVKSAGEEDVDGRPAVGLKVTDPAGKGFILFFDKASGLPVKQVDWLAGSDNARRAAFTTTFRDYKDFDGLKVATRIDAASAGEKPIVSSASEVLEFQTLDNVDPKTFAKPE